MAVRPVLTTFSGTVPTTSDPANFPTNADQMLAFINGTPAEINAFGEWLETTGLASQVGSVAGQTGAVTAAQLNAELYAEPNTNVLTDSGLRSLPNYGTRDAATFTEHYADIAVGDIVTVAGYDYVKVPLVYSVYATDDVGVAGFLPHGDVHVEHYGAVIDDVSVDCGAALNRALVNHATVHLSGHGSYWASTPVREKANGGARRIVGGNMYLTQYRAVPSWDSGMAELNGADYTVTVVDVHNFQLDGINSTGFGVYGAGGVAIKKGTGVFAEPKRIIGATNAATCVVEAPNHGYTTGDTVRIEAMGGLPMIWFGNSNGHGNYRMDVSHLRIDGASAAIGLRGQESGTSFIHHCYISNCKIGLDLPGNIGTDVNNCDLHLNDIQLLMSAPAAASSAVDEDDISRTESPLTIKTNANHVTRNWVRGGRIAMIIAGAATNVESNVFQAVGQDNSLSQVIFSRANEAIDFGAGPRFVGNWSESGNFKAMLEVYRTRNARVQSNFFAGSTGGSYEQSILSDAGSSGMKIINNSFYQRGTATPSQGRTQNAVIYVEGKHTTLQDNHYALQGTFTYDELVVLNRTTTANNIILENGQNNGTPMGVQIGNFEFDVGATAVMRKNPNTVGAFNARIDGLDIINCNITNTQVGDTFTQGKVVFASGKRIMSQAALPTSGDYARGDIILLRTPVPGGHVGWVCTTGGVAGSTAVFKTFGSIAA